MHLCRQRKPETLLREKQMWTLSGIQKGFVCVFVVVSVFSHETFSRAVSCCPTSQKPASRGSNSLNCANCSMQKCYNNKNHVLTKKYLANNTTRCNGGLGAG